MSKTLIAEEEQEHAPIGTIADVHGLVVVIACEHLHYLSMIQRGACYRSWPLNHHRSTYFGYLMTFSHTDVDRKNKHAQLPIYPYGS